MMPQNGWTPLHSAAVAGHANGVRQLLEAGANKDAADKVGGARLLRRAVHKARDDRVIMDMRAAISPTESEGPS